MVTEVQQKPATVSVAVYVKGGFVLLNTQYLLEYLTATLGADFLVFLWCKRVLPYLYPFHTSFITSSNNLKGRYKLLLARRSPNRKHILICSLNSICYMVTIALNSA